MSFERLFRRIASLIFGEGLPEKQAAALARLNPEKIYVENVRSVLDISAWRAKQICETAVRQGVFEKRIEVLCPDGVVATSAPSEEQLPPKVICWENYEEVEVPTQQLRKNVFYRLVDDADAREPRRQTA